MASLGWGLLFFCLGAWFDSSQSAICNHAQCRYDYVTAKADCSALNLDCIPVNNPDALIMDLSHNNISELSPDDFNTFSRLAELYLDYNSISDVTSLLGSNELRSLQKLYARHNVISDLPTTCQLSSLTELFVDYNSITLLRVPRCGGLRQLSADYNLIQSSEKWSFLGNISPFLNISLQFNGMMRGFEFSISPYSDDLNVSLYLDYNSLTSVEVHGRDNRVFKKLSISHNAFQSYVHLHSFPEELNAASNVMTHLSDSSFINSYTSFLKKMDVSNNSLRTLIQPIWAGKVEFLNADTNLLANLSSTTLSGFVKLTEFHVANNSLLFISPTALENLSRLQSLFLDDNALTSLFGGVFFNQSNLVELSITNNRLTVLHPDYFMGLVSLERLYLAGNQLTSVDMGLFRLMPQILTLDLSRNELQHVDLQDCAFNPNLQNISLARNKIHDTVSVFGYCNNLGILDLSYNLIQVVPGDSLSGRNKALSHLELEGNPLQCDCRLTGLRDWLRNNTPHNEPRCEGPEQHYGSVITDLNIQDFSCERPKAMTDRTNVTVLAGQNTVLACTASGIPAPTVAWINPDGTEITHEWQGRFAILQGRILHITPVEISDQGVYTCLVHNVLGETDDAGVSITVLTSPPTPPNVLSTVVIYSSAVLITIAVTLYVVACVILFRRRFKKDEKETDTKVVFRTTDEGNGTTTDPLAARNRYEAGPATRNPFCQIDADVYEEPSAGKRERVDCGNVYENVAVMY